MFAAPCCTRKARATTADSPHTILSGPLDVRGVISAKRCFLHTVAEGEGAQRTLIEVKWIARGCGGKIAKTSGDRAEKRFRDLGKNNMSQRGDRSAVRIDQFFAGLGARGDQWRHLVELAEAWCEGSGSRASIETALAEITPTEEFHAYP